MLPDEELCGVSPEKLNRAGEDYLKAILILERKNGSVRSLDIAKLLDVSKPSVSVAVKLLREGGFLTMDSDKHICLTDIGRETAEIVYDKYRVLSECLIALGVDSDTADKDACRMEHVVSPETFEKMRIFLDKEQKNAEKSKRGILYPHVADRPET